MLRFICKYHIPHTYSRSLFRWSCMNCVHGVSVYISRRKNMPGGIVPITRSIVTLLPIQRITIQWWTMFFYWSTVKLELYWYIISLYGVVNCIKIAFHQLMEYFSITEYSISACVSSVRKKKIPFGLTRVLMWNLVLIWQVYARSYPHTHTHSRILNIL